MNHLLQVADVLARIPGWDTSNASWREIRGGLTNRSWLVTAGEHRYVLRLDGAPAKALGLDRHTELAIHRNAAAAGLAPEVVHAEPDAGVLVCEYAPGPVWEPGALAVSANAEVLGALLRAVHALPRSGVSFDAPAIARRYRAALSSESARRIDADACVRAVDGAPPREALACCHNDIVASNIVGAGRPKLLDWEYACDNDPYYDLAALAGYHALGRGARDALLAAWTGRPAAEGRDRLEARLLEYTALERLWFAVMGIEKSS